MLTLDDATSEIIGMQGMCSPIARMSPENDNSSKLFSPRDDIVEELNSIRFQDTVKNKAVNDLLTVESPLGKSSFKDIFAKETE
jgi:hypothetical protein